LRYGKTSLRSLRKSPRLCVKTKKNVPKNQNTPVFLNIERENFTLAKARRGLFGYATNGTTGCTYSSITHTRLKICVDVQEIRIVVFHAAAPVVTAGAKKVAGA